MAARPADLQGKVGQLSVSPNHSCALFPAGRRVHPGKRVCLTAQYGASRSKSSHIRYPSTQAQPTRDTPRDVPERALYMICGVCVCVCVEAPDWAVDWHFC